MHHLQNLLQIEHSIQHATPVPNQEPKAATAKVDKTDNELNKLEWLSQKYNETIEETTAMEEQLQDDYRLGSGIK